MLNVYFFFFFFFIFFFFFFLLKEWGGLFLIVVATPGESVTSVVNTEEIKDIPVQEVSNVVIPSINQDGNNTI